MSPATPTVTRDQVTRLWLVRQGLATPRGGLRLTKASLTDHLLRTGGLQLDGVNILDRAHYLTLWSRFGAFDRGTIDRWLYRGGLAFEYWSHEASLLPLAHLPIARRRMRRFPPARWTQRSWWKVFSTTPASKRRVLKRLRDEGPLESSAFEWQAGERGGERPGGAMPLWKEDKRSLKLLWHAGRVAVRDRRHFRCLYDLAERVYPSSPTASLPEFEDHWLLAGLSGNGIAGESHLVNYLTAMDLSAADRRRVIARNLKAGTVVEVRVADSRTPHYARPQDLNEVTHLPEPEGTTLLSPFDSFLWQRRRAEELLGFRYRVEIYVPAAKRDFGYYVLPILHQGRLVGRVDPKVHRERGELEVKAIGLEPGVRRSAELERGLGEALRELGSFLGAERLRVPRRWRSIGS